MSIRTVENFDGDELRQWQHHFSRYPFTIDLLNRICIRICSVLVSCLSSSRIPPTKHSVIELEMRPDNGKRTEANLRSGFGG
jgi:hypothetical protein